MDRGFYVFSPVVHQLGPIDIIAISDLGDILLIDAKKEGKRLNPNRKTPSRIHRVRTDKQKKLNVIHAYVGEDNSVIFVPSINFKNLTEKED